ncbi:hypothetical protein [Asanoa siamensis]|uniref:Uncharacterized protein n=1 Tax=Asanoa siamensis TaxID=926357 RepID=A0ABQ4CPV5_9ACTN|nr:hypothetical protein [Asanoa siamensis]GIF73320.1 hypothetical protein Asi02nite_28380 [Asanoa siamensis]
MTGDEGREALARELRRLTLPELVDVLRRVLPGYGDREAGYGLTSMLVLAEATRADANVPRMPDEPPVTLEMVAWPDRDYYEGGFGPEPDLYEQGTCRTCGVDVTSTAKRAFCPTCGEVCELT